jgi:predicted transcriptional regulator
MIARYNKLYEEPAYGLSEAAVYLKVPQATLRYWLTGLGKQPPIIESVRARQLVSLS